MALRLGKLAGTGRELWLNVQHDLAIADQELGAELDEIPKLEAAE